MKKSLTLILLLAGLSATAQKLPAKATIVLTDKQVMTIDSAINNTAQMMDSKSQTNRFIIAFQPLYEQIRKQMVVDTVKAKTAPKKP